MPVTFIVPVAAIVPVSDIVPVAGIVPFSDVVPVAAIVPVVAYRHCKGTTTIVYTLFAAIRTRALFSRLLVLFRFKAGLGTGGRRSQEPCQPLRCTEPPSEPAAHEGCYGSSPSWPVRT